MTHFAYSDRNGVIEFDRQVPDGRLPIGSSGDQVRLRETVEAIARHAYDGKTLLVPGIPEADSDDQALEALLRFRTLVADRLAGLIVPGQRDGETYMEAQDRRSREILGRD